ncbi:HEAT repeat domain-containing protein [Candidatus Nitrospira bockiana]
MTPARERGQASLTAVLTLIGAVVAAVWIWKRLAPETQDLIIEQAVPLAAAGLAAATVVSVVVRKIRARRERRRRRARLMARFLQETHAEKRRDLAFALIEVNRYRLEGLEPVAPALVEVLTATLKTAVGDKQHRIRAMAASYLGVLQDKRVIPLLLKALDDDHAYVRSCAALGLGRLQAVEAKEKLAFMVKEDWDQTVRSRAREALERIT